MSWLEWLFTFLGLLCLANLVALGLHRRPNRSRHKGRCIECGGEGCMFCGAKNH